ncbi:hypothetical protein HUU05_19995 [candidate division KSB1 bacterium]|nr:hypothetical protein [candidate division KSB1 bacterium]
MSDLNGKISPPDNCIDYDVHGLVGVRLLDASPGDAAAVAKQLGPLQKRLERPPDIIIRFVEHLPTPGLRLLGLERCGFTEDSFFVLRSNKKSAKVKIAFEQIGKQCQIVCESGLRSVPLLMAIVNLTAMQKDCVPLHASAFTFNGAGIVVTGWAKGGKTEALLTFAKHGARYVGDEWILLSGDGQKMYGIPENIRLWDWHLNNLPHLRRQLKRETKLLFNSIHTLDKLQTRLPLQYLREAMPALKRQLNVALKPQAIFGLKCGPFVAKPEKIFLLMSHDEPGTVVTPTDPLGVARRMISSNRFELLPFMEHYLAFTFAFPDLKNEFLENIHERQFEILRRALAGKQAFIVRHPYPFSFDELFEKMRPHCEARVATMDAARTGANG